MFYSKKLKKNSEIQHCFFSRKNGVSEGIYESLNCGIGSNDKKENVEKNLDIVSRKFKIKKESLILMRQTHSNNIKIIERKNSFERISCDGILTKSYDIALSVLTADCIPILIYEKEKKIIGCIHAGWKGAFNGIIENTLKKVKEMGGSEENLIASLGPCISQKNYEEKKIFTQNLLKNLKIMNLFF